VEKTFGLLGEKLGHSYSPLIHSYLGDYNYVLYEVSSSELTRFMSERKFDGINITIPYKQAVIPHCATLSKEARTIGSVNTIIKDKDGLLHGYNTDYFGFGIMLELAGIKPSDKKALVLGDGGSAKTVRAVLGDSGAREVITISRKGNENYGNISRHYDADIIINTTPVGMYPDNCNSPLNLDEFRQLTGVADLIYNPMNTRLLLKAGQLGIPCINGLSMLVGQAEMASRIFTGVSARHELIDEIIKTIKHKTQNLVLIGMPGCGKSTTGRYLAEMTGRQFSDIDDLIEKTAGKNIPEIFREDGEDTFRSMETQVLGEAAKKSGIIIAAGGGVVTRPENLDLMQQNSRIVYLRNKINKLKTEGRPLSLGVGVEILAKQRLPLYEAWSDYIIDVCDEPEQTAKNIIEVIK